MSAFFPMVGATLRQSRHQVLMRIMVLCMLLFPLMLGVLIRNERDNRGEPALGLVIGGDFGSILHGAWLTSYDHAISLQRGTLPHGEFILNDPEQVLLTANRMAQIYPEIQAIPVYERQARALLLFGANIIAIAGLLIFIAVAGAAFPTFLASGAADVVLAKPVRRADIFFGRYLGGLMLFGMSVLTGLLLLVVVVGVRTGVWYLWALAAIPLIVFSGATLFALLAWLGIRFRNTALVVAVGYGFYIVADELLGILQQAQAIGFFEGSAWLDRLIEVTRYTLPNFSMLNQSARSCTIDIAAVDWLPVGVAGAWLLLALALGYNRFRRSDY